MSRVSVYTIGASMWPVGSGSHSIVKASGMAPRTLVLREVKF